MPSFADEPKPPLRERLSRPSLRRKTFVLVLALVFVPSAITLFWTTAAAAKAIRVWVTEESRTRVEQRSEQIATALERELEDLARPLDREILEQVLDAPGLIPLVLDRDSIALYSRDWGWVPRLEEDSPFRTLPRLDLESFLESPDGPAINDPEYPRAFYVTNRIELPFTEGGPEDRLYAVRRVELGPAMDPLYHSAWMIIGFGAVLTVATALFAVWFSGRLVNPIRVLRYGFQQLEGGNLEYRLHTGRRDELGELETSMNRMAKALQDSYGELAAKVRELDEQARKIHLTYEVAKAINRSLNLERILADVIRETGQLIPAELAVVGLSGEDPSEMEIAYGWPESQNHFPPGTHIRMENALAARTLDTGSLALFKIEPGSTGSLEERALDGFPGRHLCTVPLVTTSGPVGMLWIASREPFREREVELLGLLSPSLATAVEHGRLYERQAHFAGELERKVQERTQALREAQEQLIRSEKLAATGELAANLAHEINNPLSTIKNYLRLLERELGESGHEGLRFMGAEIDRIARIVAQLRQLHRPASPEYAPVLLNKELEHLAELFRQTFRRRRVELVLEPDPSAGVVSLCEDYVRQILVNLLRNALDATPAGGTVWLRTKHGEPTPQELTIMVKDTGPGVPSEIAGRIFNPFFTTKKGGKGSGLGLSVSYELARQMGGRLDFRSPEEGGAEFLLILPLSPSTRSDDRPPSEGHDPVRRAGDRIIIG